jgi:hypothetical protein
MLVVIKLIIIVFPLLHIIKYVHKQIVPIPIAYKIMDIAEPLSALTTHILTALLKTVLGLMISVKKLISVQIFQMLKHALQLK